jgi:hypothetical protein
VDGEDTLDAFAVADAPHCKRLTELRALLADHDARENLHALLVAFLYDRVDAHAVTYVELRDVLLHLFLVDFRDDRHGSCWFGGKGTGVIA